MSKYQELYETIRTQIQSGFYKAGTYLPSENELVKSSGASRDTIRKALALLVQNGYIQKKHGKGSLILAHDALSLASFESSKKEDLPQVQKKEEPSDLYELISFETRPADAMQAYLLQIPQKSRLIQIVQVHKMDQEKIALIRDALPASLFENFDVKAFLAGVNPMDQAVSVRREITCVPPAPLEKELLDLKEFDLLVCVRAFYYDADGMLFQYRESRHRPDKFRLVEVSHPNQTL